MKLLNNPYTEAVKRKLGKSKASLNPPYMGFDSALLFQGFDEGSKAQMKADAQWMLEWVGEYRHTVCFTCDSYYELVEHLRGVIDK